MEDKDSTGLNYYVESSVEEKNPSKTLSAFFQVHRADGGDQLGQHQGHGEAGEGSHEKVARQGEPDQVLLFPLVSSTQGMAQEETKSETKKEAGEGRDCSLLLLQAAQNCSQSHHVKN